ncbi:hypothetical protein BO85DRAFT_446360 [Aspergillus piperis CBS 112811]|uniref:Uncharacterized protein n=1 Tax=Aspergillus piperis CBS 112811 TaxID=1448313 RepID=A0A8G1VQT8_9EURO|nr:hypothetical protein BO85DRAFT_446360 [Aspergillus piperis CBS 112811]RAH61205.1 hypothetical protein BO85DRAFT_446360 [Aspergillus piperis CBS 112811]
MTRLYEAWHVSCYSISLAIAQYPKPNIRAGPSLPYAILTYPRIMLEDVLGS